MDAIPPLTRAPATPPSASSRHGHPTKAVAHRETSPARHDRVTVSRLADLLSRLRTMPDARRDRIEHAQREIEAGTYETPEKLDAAVTALLRDLS
jgi:hypothetical protein